MVKVRMSQQWTILKFCHPPNCEWLSKVNINPLHGNVAFLYLFKRKKLTRGHRPWDQTNLVLNSIEKVYLVLYFPQCVCFLNRTGQNSDLTVFTSKIQVFYRLEWTIGGTPWKWILTFFRYKNEYHKQVELKSRWKKWNYLPSFLFSFLSYGP